MCLPGESLGNRVVADPSCSVTLRSFREPSRSTTLPPGTRPVTEVTEIVAMARPRFGSLRALSRRVVDVSALRTVSVTTGDFEARQAPPSVGVKTAWKSYRPARRPVTGDCDRPDVTAIDVMGAPATSNVTLPSHRGLTVAVMVASLPATALAVTTFKVVDVAVGSVRTGLGMVTVVVAPRESRTDRRTV